MDVGDTIYGSRFRLQSMRGVKTEILKLISTWVAKSDDTNVVLENFVPPLFDAVLFDYQRNVPGAREPEVLACMTAFVNKLESKLTPEVPKMFDAVFECTLEMISKDFQEFPEHRTNFFQLLQGRIVFFTNDFMNMCRSELRTNTLESSGTSSGGLDDACGVCEGFGVQAVNDHCFKAFLEIPPAQFKLILDSIIWAFKHSMRNVAETGLEILHKLLQNISDPAITPEAAGQSFYQTFFVNILEHILSVVTDSSQAQVAGLTYYSNILAYMFWLIESEKVKVPLNADNQKQGNMDFIYVFVGTLLKQNYSHLNDDQIRISVKGFFSFDNNVVKFKDHLRDFLVQIKQYCGEDTSDLFIEEREKEIQQAQQDKQKIQAAVPGILNPYEEKGMRSNMTSLM